jgi:hypothetical protein
MATTPTAPNQGFTPAFKRVAQSCDHDCAWACLAVIVNKPLAEIREAAISKVKHPAHGPYWITQGQITHFCVYFGWGATAYKEAATLADLPDVAFVMVDYKAETELGRHVLFHRQKAANAMEYVIDPAYWVTEPSKQIRTDLKSLALPAWYIGVHQMNATKPK